MQLLKVHAAFTSIRACRMTVSYLQAAAGTVFYEGVRRIHPAAHAYPLTHPGDDAPPPPQSLLLLINAWRCSMLVMLTPTSLLV